MPLTPLRLCWITVRSSASAWPRTGAPRHLPSLRIGKMRHMEPSRRGAEKGTRPRPILLAILILAVAGNWVFLDPGVTLQAKDWDQIHLPYAVQTCRAIQDHGTLPYWSSLLYAGYPALATPDKPSFYPPFLLLASFLSPTAVMNWSLLLHVVIAGLGALSLGHALWRDRFGGFAAAALLMLGPGRSLAHGAPFHFWSYAWLPWILFSLHRAESKRDRLRGAAWAGIGIALFVHAGGAAPNPLLLAVPLVAWFGIGFGIAPDGIHGRLRIALLAGAVGALLAAPKLLVGIEWVQLTNRADALAPQVLKGLTWSPASWEPTVEGLLPLVPIALVLVAAYRRFRERPFWLFVAMVVAGMVLATGWLQTTVFPYVPLLNRVRSAYRTFRIANFALAIVGGYGIVELGRLVPGRMRHPSAVPAGLLSALLLGVSLFVTIPKLRDSLGDQDEFLASVPLLEEVRRLGEEEAGSFAGRGRFHVFEHDRVPDERAQAITVPLGIETLQGHVGDFRWRDFSDYLRQSKKDPARMWGMLAVRWVAAGHALDDVDFELVRRFDPAPHESVPHVDGPFLHRNLRATPRAYVPARTLFLAGPSAAVREAAMRIVWLPEFDPRHVAIVYRGEGDERGAQLPEVEEAFDGIVLCGTAAGGAGGSGDGEVGPGTDDPVVPREFVRFLLPGAGVAGDAIDTKVLRRWLASITESPVSIPIRPDGPNAVVLDVPPFAGRIVVLAERFAHAPGWRAGSGRDAPPLLPADGVASAIVLPPVDADGTRPRLRLDYRAPGLRWGHVLAVLGAALVGGSFLLGHRDPQS